MRRLLTALVMVAIVLVAFASCSEPDNQMQGYAESITVRVEGSNGSKMITPDGNVNVSHYIITVDNEASGISRSSDYLTKDSSFTVKNVPAGIWTATVDAYVSNNDSYIKVASATSAPTEVAARSSATLTVTLDTLIPDQVSGDVMISLRLPASFAVDSTAYYTYKIESLADDGSSFTYTLPSDESAIVSSENTIAVSIDSDSIGLDQGAYLFSVEVYDNAEKGSANIVKAGVDVMRLLSGLPANGFIDLSSDYAADEPQYSVTDGSLSFVAALSEPLAAGEVIRWYINGFLDDGTVVDGKNASAGEYVFTFSDFDVYRVTGIVMDPDMPMAVGSLSFKVNVIPKLPLPVISVNDNEVSIVCEVADAAIHYTIDGSEPTADSPLYTGPFMISENCTVRAIAICVGYSESNEAEEDCVYEVLKLPMPTLSLSRSGTTVSGTIGNTVEGAVYRYKIGSAPSSATDGTAISGTNFSFTRSSSATVYVRGFMDGYEMSDAVSRSVSSYTPPKVSTPTISQSGNTVTFRCSTSGATIYYSGCGRSGSCSSGGSITISQSGTMTAYATRSGYTTSNTASRYCSYTAKELPTPNINFEITGMTSLTISVTNYSSFPIGTIFECELYLDLAFGDKEVTLSSMQYNGDNEIEWVYKLNIAGNPPTASSTATVSASCLGYESSSDVANLE